MLKFFAGLGQERPVAVLKVRDAQIVVNCSTRPDLTLGNFQIRKSASEVLLKQVKPAHLMAICRQPGHLTRQQGIRNASVVRTAGANDRTMRLTRHTRFEWTALA